MKLWDSQTGREVVKIEGHKGTVSVIAFSPDGTHLATGSIESSLGSSSTKMGSPFPGSPHHPEAASPARSSNGERSRSGTRIPAGWKSQCRSTASDWYRWPSRPTATGWPPVARGAAVTLFDTASGRKLAEVEGTSNFQADGGYELAFLSRGRLAMAMLEKESIRLLDVSSSRFVKTLRGHTGFVCGIVPGPGGLSLVSASLDGTFRFWSLDEREGPQVVDARPVPITRVAYSPDGRWLATAGGQGPVALMDLRNAVAQRSSSMRTDCRSPAWISVPTGRWLACGTEWFTFPTGLIVWDLATREAKFTLAPDTRMGEQAEPLGRAGRGPS